MKDYLGNEINVGDVVVFSERGSHGYLGSFSNGKVSAYKERREEISIVDNEGYVINKKAKNVIDLTALYRKYKAPISSEQERWLNGE